MDRNVQLRVYNRTKYDIGITLQNGLQPCVASGNMILLTPNDIIQIDSNTREKKPFSSGALVAVDENNKDLTLEEIGGYTDRRTPKHLADDEIEMNLNKSTTHVRKWLEAITDPVEIYGIAEVAARLDLQQSKVDLIKAKLPDGGFDFDRMRQEEET